MIRLGTRNSQLAMWQSNWVAGQLRQGGHEVTLIPLSTAGDQWSGSLREMGGEGLFTKRLQVGLLEDEIDLAVHSLKDLPTKPEIGLRLAAVPPREDVRDALITRTEAMRSGSGLADLPPGARVGTGSLRRAAQLKWIRSDLQVLDLRGNVDTRLRKLDEGQFDAIVLACAGLRRLGLAERISEALDLSVMLSAVGQGALGLETRQDDATTIDAVAGLDDPVTHACVLAERAFLNAAQAGCSSPVAAHAVCRDDLLFLQAAILDESGRERLDWQIGGPLLQCEDLGQRLASQMLMMGGEQLLNGRTVAE